MNAVPELVKQGAVQIPGYEQTLLELCKSSDDVVVITAENRAAIRGLPQQLGDRFIDVGIAEQTMVGVAAGLALRGRIPVVHALATFLTLRAFEFIRTDVGIASLPVKLVGGVPGFLSDANGPTHQALEDVSLMRGIPGMSVVCPADRDELSLALPHVVRHPGPVYLRFNACAPAPGVQHEEFVLGRAEVLSEGSDVALLTYGFMLGPTLEAKAHLEQRGLSVRVVNLRTLAPVDVREVLRAAEAKLVVTIEDHFLVGGLFSIVSELLVRHDVRAKVTPIALEGRWFKPGLLPDVLKQEGFTGSQLAARVLRAWKAAGMPLEQEGLALEEEAGK
jgi:transketolase